MWTKSEKMLEIDFVGDQPVRVGDQFGLGAPIEYHGDTSPPREQGVQRILRMAWRYLSLRGALSRRSVARGAPVPSETKRRKAAKDGMNGASKRSEGTNTSTPRQQVHRGCGVIHSLALRACAA